MGKIVAISGHFDPFHEGHLMHMIKASMLGDFLIVIVNSDESIIKKRLKNDSVGKVNSNIFWRMEMIRLKMDGLGIHGMVVPAIDQDETVASSLAYYCPDIFAKGGDRTEDNMPLRELNMCYERSIKIVYHVGDKLNSSSSMV